MTKRTQKIIKKTVHWILVVYLVVYVVTGLGIIEFRTIEPLTFGVLGKALAMQIHDNMHWPFLALLALHTFLSLIMRKDKDT